MCPTSRLEAAWLLATPALFYAGIIISVAIPKTGPHHDHISAGWAEILIPLILINFASFYLRAAVAWGRRPMSYRGKYSQFVGYQLMPKRLAEAGRVLGMSAAFTWAVLGFLLVGSLVAIVVGH
jgi:hypothetical protein